MEEVEEETKKKKKIKMRRVKKEEEEMKMNGTNLRPELSRPPANSSKHC